MQVEFRCSNQVDDIMGSSQACNQLLKAEQQHAGRQVRCPKCQQLTTIPMIAAEPVGQPSPATQTSAQPSAASSQGSSSGSLKMGRFDPTVRCPECGSLLDARKRCTKCRYQQRTSKTDDQPLDEIEVKPAGFILFVRRKLARDLSGTAITAVCAIFIALVCFIALTAAFCALGGWGVIALPFIGLFVMVCGVIYFKTRELCTKPAAQLAVWQRPLWDWVLGQVRGQNWNTKYITEGMKVVDMRGQAVSDQDLFLIPQLSKCRVLDLENAPITDAGLIALRSLPNLRYLVLKNCPVSNEAVFRLQQSIPDAWIWH